jgi:uncharacterized protein DUF397
MTHPDNRITAGPPAAIRWRKSRRSNSQGACVELAGLADGAVAIRNSRFPRGPALLSTRAEISALIEGAKRGDFDHLLG